MNQTMIQGNLVRDAKVIQTTNNKPMTVFTVAVNEKYGDKEYVIFYDVSVFGRMANSCSGLTKGTSVFVVGKMSSRKKDEKVFWSLTASFVAKEFMSEAKQDSVQSNNDDDLPF